MFLLSFDSFVLVFKEKIWSRHFTSKFPYICSLLFIYDSDAKTTQPRHVSCFCVIPLFRLSWQRCILMDSTAPTTTVSPCLRSVRAIASMPSRLRTAPRLWPAPRRCRTSFMSTATDLSERSLPWWSSTNRDWGRLAEGMYTVVLTVFCLEFQGGLCCNWDWPWCPFKSFP